MRPLTTSELTRYTWVQLVTLLRAIENELGPEDAMASGVFMVPQVEMFDFTVDFRVEPVHA